MSPLLDYGNTFPPLREKMAYNIKITEYANGQLSETAIRECLHRSKAFMRASVLTGLKWQYLFVKADSVLRKCRRSRNGSLRHAIFYLPSEHGGCKLFAKWRFYDINYRVR